MKRDRSPEALAQQWLTAMDAYMAKAVKPGVVVVAIPRDHVVPQLARLIRRIREQDARLCDTIARRGFFKSPTYDREIAEMAARKCRDAIRAQNAKRALGCVSCSPRCARRPGTLPHE